MLRCKLIEYVSYDIAARNYRLIFFCKRYWFVFWGFVSRQEDYSFSSRSSTRRPQPPVPRLKLFFLFMHGLSKYFFPLGIWSIASYVSLCRVICTLVCVLLSTIEMHFNAVSYILFLQLHACIFSSHDRTLPGSVMITQLLEAFIGS